MREALQSSRLPLYLKNEYIDTTITFLDLDMEGCQHPHDDPLVIKTLVANKTIHRVLIDNGSSADIIFASAFDKMGIGREKLEPVNADFQGKEYCPWDRHS